MFQSSNPTQTILGEKRSDYWTRLICFRWCWWLLGTAMYSERRYGLELLYDFQLTLVALYPVAPHRSTFGDSASFFSARMVLLSRYHQASRRPFDDMGRVRYEYGSRPCYTVRYLRRARGFCQVASPLVRPSPKSTHSPVP